MPVIQIDIRKQYTEAQEIELIELVHKAIQESFKIPEDDRDIRLVVHLPHRFNCAQKLSQPELYTLIQIDCFEGRTINAKRLLYKTVVKKLTEFGIPADHIQILIREIPLQNWGIRSGQAACDVNLGFHINV